MRNKFLERALQNISEFHHLLKTKGEEFWLVRGEQMKSDLFKDMSKNVPAYKKLLEKTNNQAIVLDKDNYLRINQLSDLCWDGDLGAMKGTIAATSGSTGEPFYFPRSNEQDEMYSLTAELYLLENFQIDKKSTLYINAFAMGPWIGGVFTYNAVTKIQERGKYNLNIINTGINKNDLYAVIKKLGSMYDQVLIGCYPPLLKDIIDTGIKEKVNWKKYNLGFIFSAEGFSEDFRSYIYKQTGCKKYFTDSLNHYGTVDLGTMSYETPICILLRKLALRKPSFRKELFNKQHKLPTLTQYVPEHFYFEEEEGKENVVCSSYSGIPLMRYDLKDNGGVKKFSDVDKLVQMYFNKSLREIAKDNNIDSTLWELPFVYVFERKDFSIKLYGFEVFPETVKNAIMSVKSAYKLLTGRFTLEAAHDKKFNQFLKVNLELKKDIRELEEYKDMVKDAIIKFLVKENAAYSNAFKTKSGNLIPEIVAHDYGHPTYFGGGGKQKWVKK